MAEKCNAALRSRATFRHWTRVPLRYSDQDELGHINNGAIPMCLEEARVQLVYPVMMEHGGADIDLVIARVVIDYLKEMRYPGTIEVGTRIAKLGSKSFITEHGIFIEGSDTCTGTAETVLVYFDTVKRVSIVPPEPMRRAMAELAR